MIPNRTDPDLKLFNMAALGFIHDNGARLDGRDESNPVSLRALLLSMVHCVASKYSKVAYISVTRNDASEAACIIARVYELKWRLRIGQEGGPKFLVVHGDQATFHVIFEKLMTSVRAQDPGGLWEWLVVICGGFHGDKTYLLETVKIVCRGSGICELVGDAGVTKGFADLWMKMSHWRKCQQIVHQVITAFALELI